MIPEKLYHATYKQFLDSIKTKGLGNTKRKMWPDSVTGVVYLANDPWVAESYAEEAEWVYRCDDPDAYYDNIIILEIDVSKLDTHKLEADKNVLLDEEDEEATWEYHGIIPWEACKIFKEEAGLKERAEGIEEDSFIDFSDTATHNIAEDLHGHSKGYNIIEFSDKVGWDSSARDWARALINTLDDASIRILDYYEDKNFCDFKVNQHGDIITYRVRPGGALTIRAQESYSVVDDFRLYETLWEPQENNKEVKNTYRVSWSIIDRDDSRRDFTKENIVAGSEEEAKRLAGIPKNRRYVRDISVIKV